MHTSASHMWLSKHSSPVCRSLNPFGRNYQNDAPLHEQRANITPADLVPTVGLKRQPNAGGSATTRKKSRCRRRTRRHCRRHCPPSTTLDPTQAPTLVPIFVPTPVPSPATDSSAHSTDFAPPKLLLTPSPRTCPRRSCRRCPHQNQPTSHSVHHSVHLLKFPPRHVYPI